MLTLQTLANYLEEFLNTRFFEDCCLNGIQVEGKKEIKRLGASVSCTLEAIEKAIIEKCDALIVHHGLFWHRDSSEILGVKKKKLKKLLDHDISLLAYHLPLDAHPLVGNNAVAAKALGWTHCKPFGIGVRGEFKAMPVGEFKKKLEKYYGHPAHVALGGKKSVTSAALISGAAYKELSKAAKEGCDCFVTGSFDEPAWHGAFEERINFFALGHAATERVGPQALLEHLKKRFKVDGTFIFCQNPF